MRIINQVFLVLPYPCLQFDSTDEIFVCVIFVDFLGAKGCVAVSIPSSAEIEAIKNASNVILATDSEAYSIVFAITDIGESYLSYYWRIETTGST